MVVTDLKYAVKLHHLIHTEELELKVWQIVVVTSTS